MSLHEPGRCIVNFGTRCATFTFCTFILISSLYIVYSIKIYDTLDRSAVKLHRRAFVSCSRVKACNFSGFVNISSETFPVERTTQLWRSMRKTNSCKKTSESPDCSSSLIGQKTFFSGQSEAGNSNASGTGSVRVSAQGLVSILQ